MDLNKYGVRAANWIHVVQKRDNGRPTANTVLEPGELKDWQKVAKNARVRFAMCVRPRV
jgi:hypothetical protein